MLARLELLAQAERGHYNLFVEEGVLVESAIAECERGEHRLLDLLNFGVFTDPLHRLVWQSLPVLVKSVPPDIPRALEALYHPDPAVPDLFERFGGVKKYLDLIANVGRDDVGAIARAIITLVAEALNRLLNATDRPKFEEACASGRLNYLKGLFGDDD